MKIFILPLLFGVIALFIKEYIYFRRIRLGKITRREYEQKAASYLLKN